MAAHTISSFGCFVFGNFFGSHATYALSTCLIVCILLIIRRSRLRTPASDTENCTSYSIINKQSLEKQDLHLKNSNIPYQQAPVIEFLDSFADIECLKPPFLTSGVLAAKADVERAERAAYGKKEQMMEVVGEPRDLQVRSSCVFEDQQAPWRRHSYPLAQGQSGPLHDNSKHDETEHFCDDHDAGIIWRRRTMIFQEKV
ncbi:uncharacterized protein Z518_06244 [Rhinocladiella mackenziei CBS 650.93]|uniref:Uncharacterized protein n=1 Tax=Rhinocladiella mackenziei CBS 650.93 TaxID=1442369 RepID=A0A0D2FTF0_9EURO|nr:uncharacterized protein Z518_06244 [Rhinocladiella mackenziei CBS 650.93]KIX05372.1 hypothetical protein Z518_06244 [Rhinocladiella mackenziei CBS 650.93]